MKEDETTEAPCLLLSCHVLSITFAGDFMEDKGIRKIVVLGGGTGASMVLRGFKDLPDYFEISSIVAMADNGGSTGRLREEHGTIPAGDITAHLMAMASNADVARLFGYRFNDGHLGGDTVRNILLTALLLDNGRTVPESIEILRRLLGARGTVHPSTLQPVHLHVTHGTLNREVYGEHEIDKATLEEPRRFQIMPNEAPANPGALRAIAEADLVVIAPGSIYTSILAILLVPGIAEAIRDASGQVVMVANLINEPRHTPDWTVDRYVNEITRFLLGRRPDHVLFHELMFSEAILRTTPGGSEQVKLNGTSTELEAILVRGDYAEANAHAAIPGDVIRRSPIRHDPEKIARAILSLLL